MMIMEVAFIKVGEYTFKDSKFELVMTKNATIFWNTESSEVSYFDIFILFTYRENCISVLFQMHGISA